MKLMTALRSGDVTRFAEPERVWQLSGATGAVRDKVPERMNLLAPYLSV